MPLERLNPARIGRPLANYSHATLVPAAADLLFLSGQVGIAADGSIPDSVEEQTVLVFENIMAILAEAGMGAADLVRLNAFLTEPHALATYMEVRDRYVHRPPPASTLVVVKALARPALLVEVEAIAARLHTSGQP